MLDDGYCVLGVLGVSKTWSTTLAALQHSARIELLRYNA